KVEVGDYSVVKNTFGTRLVGYLVNTGDTPAEQLQVAASLLDASGKTVGAGQAIYLRDVLPPGERSPFLVGQLTCRCWLLPMAGRGATAATRQGAMGNGAGSAHGMAALARPPAALLARTAP